MAGPEPVELWVRGHLYEARGYIEPADRSAGILSDVFVCEMLLPVHGGPLIDLDTLTDSEFNVIDQAVWDEYYKREMTEYWSWIEMLDCSGGLHWTQYDDFMKERHDQWLVDWILCPHGVSHDCTFCENEWHLEARRLDAMKHGMQIWGIDELG